MGLVCLGYLFETIKIMHTARKEAVGTDIKVSLHTKEDVEL